MVVNKARKKSRLLLSFKAAGCIEDSQPATIVLSEVKSTLCNSNFNGIGKL